MTPAKSLYFNDGYVMDRDVTLLASKFQQYEGSDISRLSFVRNITKIDNGVWSYVDFFEDAAVSVTGLRETRQAFFLGHNGKVLSVGHGKRNIETLPDCERYGYVLRIRAVGRDIYVCGMSGQVYRRHDEVWKHIDDGMLGTYGLDFEDIDGTSENDLYAVGMGGAIRHFDGTEWRNLPSPTNVPLSNVRCPDNGEVYVCGNSGVVLRGNKDQWEYIGDPEITRNFWGMEYFENKLYLAYAGGIMVHDGTGLTDVDMSGLGELDFHRLHSGDGMLWSIGVDHLAYFDGATWRRTVCPENI